MLLVDRKPANAGSVKVGRCAQAAMHCLFILALTFCLAGCIKKSTPQDSESDSAASSLVFERPSEIKCSKKTFANGISDEEIQQLLQKPEYKNAQFEDCTQTADSTNLVGNNLEKALFQVSFGEKKIPIVAEKAEISLMKSSFFTAKVLAAKNERALKNANTISETFQTSYMRVAEGKKWGLVAKWFKFNDPQFLKFLTKFDDITYGKDLLFDAGKYSGIISPMSAAREGGFESMMNVQLVRPVEKTAADKAFWEAFCKFPGIPTDPDAMLAFKRIKTEDEWNDMLQLLNSIPK